MSTGVVTFTRVVNVFSGEMLSYRARHSGGPLSTYLPGAEKLYLEHDGRQVEPAYVPRPGDRVFFTDFPREGQTIALLVVAVIIAGGSYLQNRLSMAKQRDDRGGTDFGPRNTFGGIQTIAQNGTPVPFVYGKARVGGNIIDSFETATIDEDKFIDPIENLDDLLKDLFGNDVTILKENRLSRSFSTLNTRVALCMGPVETIGDIEIDERPITEYPGLVVQTRRGTNVQQSIPGFNRSVNSRLLAQPVLQASPVTVTTQTEIETAEVVLQFTNGLYKVKDDGFKFIRQIEIDVDYRLKDATAWTNLGTFNINDFATTAVNYRIRLPILERNVYEIRVTRNTADSSGETNFDAFTLWILNEIDFSPRNHPGLAMMSFQQIPGDQVSPVNPTNYTAVVTGINTIRQYTDETTYTTGWTDNPAWIAADFITNAEVGLGKFFDWDDIDILSFIDWAEYCDEDVDDGNGFLEKRATFNRAFSTPSSAFEVLQTITAGSGAMLIYSGSKFRAVIDRPSPQLQTFTAANTKPETFGIAWFPKPELPRRVFGRFFNELAGYKLDSTQAEDPDAVPGERLVEKRVDLLHVTRKSQVGRELMRIVNYNRYVTRGVQFQCGLQGVNLKLGDVIGVSEKSLALGLGTGALVRVATDERTLQLDDEITMLPGTTYQIEIQHKADGVIVKKNLVAVSAATTTDIVQTVDDLWPRAITRGDKYAVGIVDEYVELYRIDDIQLGDLGQNFQMTIRAGLYDERVFDLTPQSNPDEDVDEAPGRNDVPPRLDDDGFNLDFRNAPTLPRFGRQRRRVIDIDWEAPEDHFSIDHYEVWFRENITGGAWIPAGTTKSRRFELEIGVEDDVEYEVAVRGVSPVGHTLALDQSTSALITTTPVGVEGPPPDLLTGLGAYYRCDEGTTGTLFDAHTVGPFDLTESGGTIGSQIGVIGSSRGQYTGARHHQRAVGIGDTHDTAQNSGENSISVAMWAQMKAQTTDQSFCEVWDVSVAANRGFIVRYEVAFDTLVWQMPGFGMTDGGSSWDANVWYFIGASYNNVTDVVTLYRREQGSSTTQFAQSVTGLGSFQNTNRHIWRVGGTTATSSESWQDLVAWWGPTRALGRVEFDAMYNSGAGLDLDQFT